MRGDVTSVLHRHRAGIVDAWETWARTLAPAAGLSRDRLLGEIPNLVPVIATLIARPSDTTARDSLRSLAAQHAMSRMQQGFDLTSATQELTILRSCILKAWEAETAATLRGRIAQDRQLDQVIDRLLVTTVRKYGEVQERTLRALDRVASMSLESSSLDELLQRLAAALVEELPSVEYASIHLLEDGELHLRAAAGPAVDRSIYGIPMLRGTQTIGVARVGSRHAETLSERDRQLFESMVCRATATIHQQMFREAAERRAAQLAASEARLREVEARLRLAMEVAELEPWQWDVETQRVTCSARTRAMLGLPIDEEPTLETLLSLVPEDERESHAEAWREALTPEAEEPFAREHRIVRPSDGRERWLSVRARPRFDAAGRVLGVFGTVMEITDQKRAEKRMSVLADASELLSSSLDYRRTLAHVAEAMVPRVADGCAVDVVQPDGTLGDYVAIAHGDPVKAELVREVRRRQLPDPDAPGGIARVIRTGEPEMLQPVSKEYLAGIAQNADELATFENLGLEAVLMVPIGRSERPIGALTLAQTTPGRQFDSDDVKLATQIADRAATAIEKARLHEQTARAAELRERLLSVISHDLRTPLTSIELASALLSEALPPDEPAHAQAQVVRRNAARIGTLVNDLVDLSLIQEGRLTLELRSCPLSRLLERLTDAMRASAVEAGIELRTRSRIEGVHVRCDRPRLRDALSRILKYSFERASEGDVVTLGAHRSGDRVMLTFEGPGIGEEAEDLEALSELYWRGKVAADRARGLGLFIARGVIEAHGGRMWVERNPSDGRRLVVSLRIDASRGSKHPEVR